MITRRENLMRTFRHEKPQWIPVTGHCDPYNQPSREGMDEKLAAALGTVRWCDESTVTFSRYLGLDIFDWYAPPIRSSRRNVTVEWKREGDDTFTFWHTPLGDLREARKQFRADGTSHTYEHAVKTPDDLPKLAAIFEDEQFEYDPDAVQRMTQRKKLIGEDGVVSMSMPGTPLGMLVRVWAGVENTVYLHVDAPQAMRDTMVVMEANHLRQFDLAAGSEGDLCTGVDDTSTTTISPAMFEQYCMDYTDHVADVVHRHGKIYLHHSCGLIRDIVDMYRQTKMDGVHAVTTPPMGNITIAEAKRRLGPRISSLTALGQMFASMENWDAVAASVKQMYIEAAPGDNMIFGLPADPTKTMAQTQRLREECIKCQRWLDGQGV